MAVHAHPDDEIFGTGGVFARAHDEGMRTVLVCATGGEEGEIVLPERDTPEEHARLAEIREQELRRACAILGIDELYFLGYRDSGMLGTPANDNPESFFRADPVEAVGRVVRLIRQIRPDVLVTYDQGGGYGHPDHVTAHRITTAAVEAAADPARYPEYGPAWSVPKFYNTANPASTWERLGRQLEEHGLPVPDADAEYDFRPFVTPEEAVTTRVDVRKYVPQKRAALAVHETQIGQDGWIHAMPADIGDSFLGTELFIRVHSSVPASTPEDDLFAGLREPTS